MAVTSQWDEVLAECTAAPSWAALQAFVAAERARGPVHPPEAEVLAALDLTPLSEVRVVILGQDPYHGPGQAHGLSFSVRPGVPVPPSLRNVFTVLEADVGVPRPDSGSLVGWARQGVLLLNTVLTVAEGRANSHRGHGWEEFTDAVIRAVDAQPGPVVFMLWGAPARAKASMISDRHLVLTSSHPSGLSAHRTDEPFMRSRPFSRANAFLSAHDRSPVDWHRTAT